MKSGNIYTDLKFDEKKAVVSVLFETDFTKEIRIAMHSGTVMKEHKTSFPIVVEIVDGEVDFGVEQQVIKLRKGDVVALDSHIPHDLVAKENTIIRLTLNKDDRANRVADVAAQ